ncbi:MAG TPA: ZIP family metal transporter [Allosphingosinicella sp.]
MLAASFFSLILPGLEAVAQRGGNAVMAAGIVGGAILLGAVTLQLINQHAPHEHFIIGPNQGAVTSQMQRIWLFVIAITLHNFPEGLAVGVSFGGGNMTNGTATAVGIGLQNVPEGLAVAVSLASVGYSRGFSFLAALATGLVEPVGGFLGIAAVTYSSILLPWGLGFAAGAMIWVVSSEIIPETHREGQQNSATTALMGGLVLMLFLDWTLG